MNASKSLAFFQKSATGVYSAGVYDGMYIKYKPWRRTDIQVHH